MEAEAVKLEFQKPARMSGKSEVLIGIRDGIPVMAGYAAVSFALGISMKAAGLTPLQGMFMSLLNNASAGEYAGLTMVASAAPLWETALIILITNARYLLMSCALSQKLSQSVPVRDRLCIGFVVTDELFGMAVARPGRLQPAYYYGMIMAAAPGWAVGTFLGVSAGQALPPILVSSLSVALYGMFLAVIIPPCRENRVLAGLVCLSFGASFLFTVMPWLRSLSEGTRTIVLTIAISAFAAWKFPVGEEQPE